MGVVLGEEVGYKIRGDHMVDKNQKTRLTYLTEGVLLRQLSSDKNLSAYASVIINEAHERTVEVDLLLAMLKKVVSRRPDFKVVIMSATIDAKMFQDYYNNSPLVHIAARNFNIEVRHTAPRQAGRSVVVLAAAVVERIHTTHEPGHILVFLPGEEEIQNVCKLVKDYTKDLDVFPLYSAISGSDQRLALNSSGPNRKCIVSTNIAETSLTIDNVVYIVDSGLSRQMGYNTRLRMDMLELRPISQASAKQRTGKAGQTRDGVCYRLYSKEDYDRMAPSTEPSIRRASVEKAILRLVATGYRKFIDFDWITAPRLESIACAA